ncbi:ATP-dependent DNA ligase [Thermoflavimicrobium dichotomicum]|uniref:DNA ligase (ATP) n=1 Tax=Thermoflavimicrobium dichotomicum TaxID=46223 RepID=A0A1I3TD92_9BACL|nr:RNA ligase family protein [Thermoflavimicrobium dichotomicum]SFJ69094.1 bifunctional non-homologous end joining protein LigD [Thermoflavimicrobium dichotomicum]
MVWNPVVPFEPVRMNQSPAGENWIAQVKWDGVRVLTYCLDHEVKLFNRKKNERTLQYPELLNISSYCKASSVILDGEVIALVDGKPSFHEVMKRDALRTASKIEKAKKQIPITYMIFDILYHNGQWVTEWPLMERQALLQEIITPQDYVQTVPSFSDGKALFEVMKAYDMEGIVYKDRTSTYVIGGKDRRWIKKKVDHDLYAVVGGVTMRQGIVNALLLGVYDQEGKLHYIGHAGTGKLTKKEWYAFTQGIQPLIREQSPFVNDSPRMKGAIWLEPQLVVKVKFAEWLPGKTLRQPSIQAFVEVKPMDCTFDQ